MDDAAGQRDQGGDEGSGMSDSGSPKQPHAVGSQTNKQTAGPSGRQLSGGGGGVDGSGSAQQAGGDTVGDPATNTDARVRRRREINRNSQKRIRERRNKEMDELREEVRHCKWAGGGGYGQRGH